MVRPVLIGVAGGSGSGKTTLALALREHYGAEAVRIGHDLYYHDLSEVSLEERRAVNFDHPDSLDNELLARHLEDLRAGRSIPQLRYDYAQHLRLPALENLAPAPIVLVDGILTLSVPGLRDVFDWRVFVDTDEIDRFVRRLRRDVAERGRTLDSVCEQFLTSVRPMHRQFVEPARAIADQVVSGTTELAANTRSVVAAIESVRGALAEG